MDGRGSARSWVRLCRGPGAWAARFGRRSLQADPEQERKLPRGGALRCRLTRVYARVFVMHKCACGLNAGSWKPLIQGLLTKLEDEAVVSTVTVPDRASSREISWDTLHERFVHCPHCKANECTNTQCHETIVYVRHKQKGDRAKSLFDSEVMEVRCCSADCRATVDKQFQKLKRTVKATPDPGYVELQYLVDGNPGLDVFLFGFLGEKKKYAKDSVHDAMYATGKDVRKEMQQPSYLHAYGS